MTRERRRFWFWVSAAMLGGVLLRVWFIHHLSRVAGDSLVYGDIARNLIRHGVYGFAEPGPAPGSVMIRPTLIRLPGYPLFLAACFRLFGMEHYGAVLYVQLVADLCTCLLAAGLAGRTFGRRAFLPVLWLGALCPFLASYVATPLTETLVLASIALAFYAFARWEQAGAGYNRWLWVVATALASSILLRPEEGLLAAAVVPGMLWVTLATAELRAKAARSATPVLVGSLCVLLPLVPWAIRNWKTFHVVQPLAPRSASDPGERQLNGFNRWYRTWGIEFASTEDVYWNYDGNRIELMDIPTRAFGLRCMAQPGTSREAQPLYARTAALLEEYNRNTSAMPANDAGFGQLAQDRIGASPICGYVVTPAIRVLDMMLRPRTELMPIAVDWWRWREHRGQSLFAGAYAGLNLAYFVLALAGLWSWVKSGAETRPLLWSMVAMLVLRTALLLTLDNSEARYTLEFFPVLFVWAGGLFAD